MFLLLNEANECSEQLIILLKTLQEELTTLKNLLIYDRPKTRKSDLFTSKDAGTVYSFIQDLSLQQHNHVTDSVAVKHLNFEPPSSSGNKIKFKEFWDAFEATCPQKPKDLHN